MGPMLAASQAGSRGVMLRHQLSSCSEKEIMCNIFVDHRAYSLFTYASTNE